MLHYLEIIIYSFLIKILATVDMGILCVNRNNNNLGDANFYIDDLKTIIPVRRLARYNKRKKP